MANSIRIHASVKDDATPKVRGIRGAFNDLGAEAKKSVLTGVGLAGGVSAFNALSGAVSGAIGYVQDSIGAASMLGESVAKVNVVFGDSSEEVRDWASTMATSFGISEQKALEAAGTYGNLFQAFGMGQGKARDMSTALVELAADMASFNNTSVDDALIALRSGLSGETEPLKRYGVAISDARMRTELASQGFTNLGATLTPLQKTTAAYALIMKDTALAQGDSARSAGGYAMQQKFLEASLADVSAEIGQKLLPVLTDLAHFANDKLVPALSSVADNAEIIGDVAEIVGNAFGNSGTEMVASAAEAEVAMQDMADTYRMELDSVRAKVDEYRQRTGASLSDATDAVRTEVSEQRAAHAAALDAVVAMYYQADDDIGKASKQLAEIPRKSIETEHAPIRNAAYQSAVEYAKGLIDGQNQPKVAMEALVQLQEETLSNSAQVARLLGQLNSQELAAGLADSRPAVNAQARATRLAILNQLSALGHDTRAYGYNAGTSFGDGLKAAYGYVRTSAGTLAAAVRGQIGINSEPRDADSPLRGVTHWGGNIVKTIAGGMESNLGAARSAAGHLAGALAPGVSTPSLAFAGAGGAAYGAGTVVVPVYLDGRQIAEVVADHNRHTPSGVSRLPR